MSGHNPMLHPKRKSHHLYNSQMAGPCEIVKYCSHATAMCNHSPSLPAKDCKPEIDFTKRWTGCSFGMEANEKMLQAQRKQKKQQSSLFLGDSKP